MTELNAMDCARGEQVAVGGRAERNRAWTVENVAMRLEATPGDASRLTLTQPAKTRVLRRPIGALVASQQRRSRRLTCVNFQDRSRPPAPTTAAI